MKISKERADELDAKWEAASPTERLRLPRLSWFAADDVTYFETPPSKLELQAADRIAELEAALRDLVMLERITTPDMSGKRRTWAHMQNGTILADALDKARDVLAKTT